MKYLIVFSLSVIIFCSCQTKKETSEASDPGSIVVDTIKKSIPKEENAMIGDAHISINYHSPGVRGRIIWGGLVPLDQVWVTGAHRATSFEIDKDFEVNGTLIPAGKYAIFTIPGKETWIFIINKNWEQHLTDEYDPKDDIVRMTVEPETEEPHTERLTYSIEQEGDRAGELVVRWEKLEVSLPFKIK